MTLGLGRVNLGNQLRLLKLVPRIPQPLVVGGPDVLALRGHGVVDPLDLHCPGWDDALDAGEGSLHQHRLHFQIEGQHRHLRPGGDGLGWAKELGLKIDTY